MKRIALFAGVIGLVAGQSLAQIDPPTDADIYVLGEVHDNPLHHAEQARLVGLIGPKAVVWEMLSGRQAKVLPGVTGADADAMARALEWEASGWPDFSMYYPIFQASGQAEHLAGAVPREELKSAITMGAAAVLKKNFPGIDAARALPELAADALENLKAEQAEAHCNALPTEMLGGMVEAQRLRDAWMAGEALAALDRDQGPVVIITGTGHARTDTAIPAILANLRPEVTVWSLGQVESDPGADAPFDAVRVTDPAPRDDPCAQFAVPKARK